MEDLDAAFEILRIWFDRRLGRIPRFELRSRPTNFQLRVSLEVVLEPVVAGITSRESGPAVDRGTIDFQVEVAALEPFSPRHFFPSASNLSTIKTLGLLGGSFQPLGVAFEISRLAYVVKDEFGIENRCIEDPGTPRLKSASGIHFALAINLLDDLIIKVGVKSPLLQE